jgi:hypothetical protein
MVPNLKWVSKTISDFYLFAEMEIELQASCLLGKRSVFYFTRRIFPAGGSWLWFPGRLLGFYVLIFGRDSNQIRAVLLTVELTSDLCVV